MISRTFIINLLVWFLLTIITAAFAVTGLDWIKYYKLTKQGVAVQGWVVGKEPDNHRFIRYSYVVDQSTFSGFGNAGRGNPQFDELRIGDKVLVVYDPKIPEKSFLGNASEQLKSITRGVLFLSISFPSLLIIAYNFKRKKRTTIR
jgi:hypothetical protein